MVTREGRPAWDDASVRQRIAQFACEAAAIKYVALRQLTRLLRGGQPGSENSITKLVASELLVRMHSYAYELLGPYAQILHDAPHAIDRGKWSYRMLSSRSLTIGGGTSEIQRNILGDRVLGLPRG
jgi:alkylation response protein AidB-like acyl-CoA dehydrogenase